MAQIQYAALVGRRTAVPTSASDAQAQLKALFPGVSVPLTHVQAAGTGSYAAFVPR